MSCHVMSSRAIAEIAFRDEAQVCHLSLSVHFEKRHCGHVLLRTVAEESNAGIRYGLP